MKIKIKDEMDKILLSVNHKEFLLIKESLEAFHGTNIDTENINSKLFDKDEFKNNCFIKLKISKMLNKINNKLKKIFVY
jgi:hypothetical protein